MKEQLKRITVFTLFTAVIAAMLTTGCARNLKYSEHSPSVSPDGKMMIYQSNRITADNYQVYVRLKVGGTWLPPVPLVLANAPVDNTAGPFVTYDQNSLLLSSDNKNGKGDVDIYISKRVGKLLWGIPENIGAPINTKGYDGFASLSPDGKRLYFVRECTDKKGYKEHTFGIYMSKKIKGKWKKPVRMPAPINTASSEFGPVILADGKTLIFSSARSGGFGGYDLYKTEMISEGRWSKPVNLGKSINTKYDDRMASVPAAGNVIFVSRPTDEAGGKYRIEEVKMPKQMRQSSVITVEGRVYDKDSRNSITDADIKITDVEDGYARNIKSNIKDGKYFIVLSKGKKYDVAVQKAGYTFYSEKFDLKNVSKFSAVLKDIQLSPIRKGTRLILRNLYFKYNSARLLKESDYEMKRLLNLMKKNPAMKIEVSGHTDNIGSLKFNKELSLKRAQAVKVYMIKNGLKGDRVTAVGYGFEKPIVKKGSKKQMAKNRRVEVKILSTK